MGIFLALVALPLAGGIMFATLEGVAGQETLWTRQFGTESADLASGVAVDGKGSVYLAGSTQGAFHGHANLGGIDVFIAKVSGLPSPPESDGSTTPFPAQTPTPFPAQTPTPFPAQTPTPFPAQTPTPTSASGGSCTLAPGGAGRAEAGWLLMGLVLPGLALASRR